MKSYITIRFQINDFGVLSMKNTGVGDVVRVVNDLHACFLKEGVVTKSGNGRWVLLDGEHEPTYFPWGLKVIQRVVKGYLIQDAYGAYLSSPDKGLMWLDDCPLQGAWVHGEEQIDEIKRKFKKALDSSHTQGRSYLPTTMTPASWLPREGVEVTGSCEPFILN